LIRPVVSIYQNPDHIAGLVQQLFNQPLVTGETRENESSEGSSRASDRSARADIGVEVALPTIGKVKGGVGGSTGSDKATAVSTSSRSSQSFVYSQAYYLDLVRKSLRNEELIAPSSTKQEIRKLRVGDFVEYTAEFSAPVIPSLMDVLTPELVGAISEYQVRKSGRDGIDFGNFEKMKSAAAELDLKANSTRDLAVSVARALQADFRQETTREYYGTLTGLKAVTAVTICDAERFVVGDADRILDGSYTVLGKVTSRARQGMPVFERNKLLSTLTPDAVDQMLDSAKKQLELATSDAPFGQEHIDQLMEVQLHSRVPGLAFQVVPIAVFI
jgi:hypothetical protein